MNNFHFRNLYYFADFCVRVVLVPTLLRLLRISHDGRNVRDDLQLYVHCRSATCHWSVREKTSREFAF